MRYVVGAHAPNNDGTIADGLYVYGKYGLSFILTNFIKISIKSP